ncbi:serine/threonine-protein kinase [Marinobacter caseinilyticus]|uniref:serine/threonine-protein kinase n=1 Tax=Marinobacter caseinilyticus TaxID=2692195 RepID=UPI00140D0D18|nr:serine/threonine-protein kinase [Marinobacter caseinilyticus]
MAIRFLLTRLFSLRLVIALFALVVVFGADKVPALNVLDQTLFDLVHQATDTGNGTDAPQAQSLDARVLAQGLERPDWGFPMVRAALALSLMFLMFALPQLGAALSVLLVTLIATALLITQAGLMLYQHLWLPLGQVVVFLLAGFVTMLFWLQPFREIQSLRANVQQARYQLGKLLLQQGQPDQALEALATCPPDEDTLDLQYDIAIQQERKRQYDSASRTYEQILSQKQRFRDVRERLDAMQRLTSDSTTSLAAGFDSTRTLVMPDQSVSKPTLGRYEIDREIGRGAMGVVYLGKDPKIARTVAIKTLSYNQFEQTELGELKSRFHREAEAAGRLNHPAIVTVYDVGEEADLAFIAMDFAVGKPLSDYARADRLLPLPVILTVLAQVAEALDYAHGQKIVHRDIKPGNIIYDAASKALKITDFGIAKITDDSRTRTGSVMGSPLYMSPEQLKGQKVTGASDIYSLGVTLYKLVSGETPYNGDTLANLTYQILNKRARSVREFNPELPDSVVRLINKAIQKEPAKRFASAGAMAEAMHRAASRASSKETS